MSTDIRTLLHQFTVFTEVPEARYTQLTEATITLRFSKGDRIWEEGDNSKYLYFIVSGSVKIIKHSETGKDVIIEIFGPRDAIGVSAMLVSKPYITEAVCLSPVTALSIPSEIILELLGEVPGMALRSLKGMARRQRMLMQKVKEMAGGGVEYRIAHLLLKLANRIGAAEAENQISIPINLSRQDIADLVGTTVETAIRVMSRWRKLKIVDNDRTGLVILDRTSLENVAAGLTLDSDV
ncbi:MAG: Crp/Fnr family transcriptional regulator [Myxococcales bacterium]|jgi:CRP/FNR family transcriptional regulator|nr:Crp/Fnr family transcriptional regulator [Myxococcales bacterium]